jgi:hypothetical protein
MRDFLRQDLQLPRSAATALDNLGKFEIDDFVCRIKYHSLDVTCLAVDMCSFMEAYPRFKGRFPAPRPRWANKDKDWSWGDIDLNHVVDGSRSSSLYIRELAKGYLEKAFDQTFDVDVKMPDDTTVSMKVSYPRLKMSPNPENQLRNVVDWLHELNQHLPEVKTVIAAGLCSAWQQDWFSPEKFSRLVPEFPDWLPFDGPFDVLNEAKIQRISYGGSELIPFLRAIMDELNDTVPIFNEVFNLVKQPENKFGSPALLVPLKGSDFKDRVMHELHMPLREMIRGSTSRMVMKLKNKGQVVSGLIFGFTSNVEVSDNYLAQVNGDPNTLRKQYLRSDLKNYLCS